MCIYALFGLNDLITHWLSIWWLIHWLRVLSRIHSMKILTCWFWGCGQTKMCIWLTFAFEWSKCMCIYSCGESVYIQTQRRSGLFCLIYLITQGSTHDYNTRQRDDIRTNRTRVNLTEKCHRNYLQKTINFIPNHILTRIDTQSIERFGVCCETLFDE